jgi:patched 1 protein
VVHPHCLQIMATGLSVDYAVYFAQKFMTVTGDGTGNSRMIVALGDTGYSVFLGGFTALCGGCGVP